MFIHSPKHLYAEHDGSNDVRPNVERLVVPREGGHDALPVSELRSISGVDEVVDDAELRNGVFGENGVAERRWRRCRDSGRTGGSWRRKRLNDVEASGKVLGWT